MAKRQLTIRSIDMSCSSPGVVADLPGRCAIHSCDKTIQVLLHSPRVWFATFCSGYDGSPPALFRPGSFVWKNSLFVVCGHTATSYDVTSKIWRADIQAFEEAPEGMWRPVNWTVADDTVNNAAPTGMYGHTATVLATDDEYPQEVRV